MEVAKPDMVIGIDFGMTCTGVSYANLSIGSETVRWVQKWPGRFQANENKVPTVVVYPTNKSEPSSWGFLSETIAETTAEDKEYREWFKTSLDPEKLRKKQAEDPENSAKSMAEVEKWYEDYFRKLYQYLAFKLESELSGVTWKDARIEFLFSVPTTWAPNPTVELFRNITTRAGFGECIGHTVSIGLTEAEAAAVHVSTEASGIFRERDILLVCDAGGGTTDLSVLRVTNAYRQSMSLEQLDVVFGETIGSAAIDFGFQKLVQARLEAANSAIALPISIEDACWEMMKSKDFQAVKCEHGSPDDTPFFSIAISKLPPSYNNSEHNIKDGEMKFSRDDLQRMFDKQIEKLFKLIDTQLESLRRKHPYERVAHLVLSGGLGNSAYVQQRLSARYAYRAGSSQSNSNTMQVRIAPDPQLAVCKGLVADRIRKLTTSQSIIGWRCCRASYGTICKILFDKKNPGHIGKPTMRDPINNKLYITQAVAWFIKKGEAVSVDQPIIHNFVRKLSPGDPRRAFPTSIITSDVDKEYLPLNMGFNTRVLCEIESDLSSADEKKFTEKNKQFWRLSKHYFKVEYQVRVIIGAADIRFELWFDKQKLNRDQPIRVEWTPAPPPPEPVLPVLPVDFQSPSIYVPHQSWQSGSPATSFISPKDSKTSPVRPEGHMTHLYA